MQQDSMHTANKLKISKFDDYETYKFNKENSRTANFFQMVSNSVLIVILMVVLLFMIFVACFLLVTMFKKNTVVKQSSDNNQKESRISCWSRMTKSITAPFKLNHKIDLACTITTF